MSHGDVFVVGHADCGALSRNNLIIVNPDSDRRGAWALPRVAAIASADLGRLRSVT
jgi:carbonic anhydrase